MSKPIYADDLLSRIEYSEKWNNAKCPEWVKGIINNMPKAQLSGEGTTFRWIPCGERLPKERQWVLCQCRAKTMEVLRINGDNDWEQLYPKRTFMGSFVTAWMPLPTPYCGAKMEVEDDN